MSAQIIPFPPVKRISKSFDVIYGSKDTLEQQKRFICGVIRDTYIEHPAMAVAAGEEMACEKLEIGYGFHEAMAFARDEIELMEKVYEMYLKEKK